jgi:hypothetical protein
MNTAPKRASLSESSVHESPCVQSVNPAMTSLFQARRYWRGVGDLRR